MFIKIIDYPSLIKESPLTNEEKIKLIEIEKYIKDNIKPCFAMRMYSSRRKKKNKFS